MAVQGEVDAILNHDINLRYRGNVVNRPPVSFFLHLGVKLPLICPWLRLR